MPSDDQHFIRNLLFFINSTHVLPGKWVVFLFVNFSVILYTVHIINLIAYEAQPKTLCANLMDVTNGIFCKALNGIMLNLLRARLYFMEIPGNLFEQQPCPLQTD